MSNMFSKLFGNSLALTVLPIILIPAIFYKTTFAMVQVWMVNETFTHGFLVLPLTLWLIWRKRTRLLMIDPRPEPAGLTLLVLFLFGWFVSAIVDVEVAQQFCMVTVILMTVWTIAGRRVLLSVLFPLMFLYFAVPFGQVFIPPLMEYTAGFTVTLIKMIGIPVYRDGLSFILPTGSWSVVEECSGVRYLIASLFLGSMYAYLNYSTTRKRVIFILLSFIVPIVGNGLRAFGIVMIGHFSGMKLAVGADHLLYGWVFFGIIIFLLFYAGSFWRDAECSADGSDVIQREPIANRRIYSPSVFLLATLFLMMTLTVFASHIKNERVSGVAPAALQFPAHIAGWQFDAERTLSWQPVYVNPDLEVSRVYFSDEGFVQLNVAYYHSQRRGAEAVSTNNKLTNPYSGEWKLISKNEINEGGKYFTESELKHSEDKLLVWSWYRVGDYETPNPYMAKVMEAYNLIFEGRSDVSILSIATEFNDTKKISRHKLHAFWKQSNNALDNKFEQIRNE